MTKHVLIMLLALGIAACQSNPNKAAAKVDDNSGHGIISAAEKKATPHGREILATGRRMTLIKKEIIPGSCWDYIDTVYDRAGYPRSQRKTVFKGSKNRGPYADIGLVQPGDWLYYINHQYGGVEHSAIFVGWEDPAHKKALMLSYGGENRRKPARYRDYDLSNIYQIIRPAGQQERYAGN
ncbi:hypothetical protein Thiosp_04375 [Thiorhodovibrio litoralis]|nr:hypothetical protein [Thiorhodovibrio winogradskyi]WPL14529.1 hypothetical protein Thiosp_04375 [Thiorhodovibrio litoralis]